MSSFPTLQVFHKTKPIKHGAFLEMSKELKDHQGHTQMTMTGTWCELLLTEPKVNAKAAYTRDPHM